MAAEVMAKLPPILDEVETRRIMGDTIQMPLNIVLLQEIARYNILLESIRTSLIELDKGIQGLVVMSAELEEIFNSILDGRVPTSWLKAYPSLKPLGAWSRDLSQRIEQFTLWCTTLKPPVKFWLSGFTFPTGFLTAVLQTSARKYNVSIDSLTWDFSVSTVESQNIILPPKDGVYVQGLFLEGASWDKKNSQLIESAPMQLVTPMPAIHFKPVENKKKYTRNLYECPCYYYPDRAGGQGRQSYVVAVELRAGANPPAHWVQRGVALLMSLSS
jgi:dynein heavy chain